MKKKSILSSLLLIIGLGSYTVLNTSYSGGFGAYSATSCTTCHGNDMPSTSITIDNLPATYALGQAYPISVTVSNINQQLLAGFQLQTNIGSLSTTEPGITVYANGRSMGHNTPNLINSGVATFTMTWTAPSSGSAAANFAAQGIAANGNNSNSGDGGAFVTVSNIVLPVSFINLSAIEKNERIEIRFETENESKIKNFEIEKSTDGYHFSSIKTILPQNNGNYKVEDLEVTKGETYYYRIKEVSMDNQSTLSKVARVLYNGNKQTTISLTLVSNKQLFISGLDSDDIIDFSLYNLAGKKVQHYHGSNSTIELYKAFNGVYIAVVETSKDVRIVKKIQIQ